MDHGETGQQDFHPGDIFSSGAFPASDGAERKQPQRGPFSGSGLDSGMDLCADGFQDSKGNPHGKSPGNLSVGCCFILSAVLDQCSVFYGYIISMAETYMLRQKQSFIVGLPLLVLAYYMNRRGLKSRARVMEGIFWFVLLPVLAVLLLSAGDLAFSEIWITSFQWKEFARGSLLLLALLHPIELVWFYRGSIKEGGMKAGSFLSVGLLFLGIFCAVLGSLGRKLTMMDPNPVMSMAQGVAIPGGIMARLDIFLIAFWIVGVFCVFSGYLFYGNEGLCQAFQTRGRIAGNILSYGGLFLGTNQLLDHWDIIWEHFNLFLYGNLAAGLLLPVILFLMARRRKTDAQKQ